MAENTNIETGVNPAPLQENPKPLQGEARMDIGAPEQIKPVVPSEFQPPEVTIDMMFRLARAEQKLPSVLAKSQVINNSDELKLVAKVFLAMDIEDGSVIEVLEKGIGAPKEALDEAFKKAIRYLSLEDLKSFGVGKDMLTVIEGMKGKGLTDDQIRPVLKSCETYDSFVRLKDAALEDLQALAKNVSPEAMPKEDLLKKMGSLVGGWRKEIADEYHNEIFQGAYIQPFKYNYPMALFDVIKDQPSEDSVKIMQETITMLRKFGTPKDGSQLLLGWLTTGYKGRNEAECIELLKHPLKSTNMNLREATERLTKLAGRIIKIMPGAVLLENNLRIMETFSNEALGDGQKEAACYNMIMALSSYYEYYWSKFLSKAE